MENAYVDIINLQRPDHTNDVFGRKHPRMSLLNRAKIFAPFAALRGFEEAVAAKEIPYVPRRIPDADEEYELNRRLRILYEKCRNGKLARENPTVVAAEYFVPCVDKNSDAYGCKGQYQTITGIVRKLDIFQQYLVVGEERIDFRDLAEINDPSGTLFALPVGWYE